MLLGNADQVGRVTHGCEHRRTTWITWDCHYMTRKSLELAMNRRSWKKTLSALCATGHGET